MSTGFLPGYETIFITKTDMPEPALSQLREKLTAIVNRFKGSVVVQEEWGRRKLAYPIKREGRGNYTYFAYSGEPSVVAEFERNLRLNEHMLRFMTINLADEFDAAEFKKTYVSFLKRDREPEGGAPGRFDRGDRYDRYDRGDRGGYDREERSYGGGGKRDSGAREGE